jgi:hypothetical protein
VLLQRLFRKHHHWHHYKWNLLLHQADRYPGDHNAQKKSNCVILKAASLQKIIAWVLKTTIIKACSATCYLNTTAPKSPPFFTNIF